jgi:hypothetical protein
LRESAAGSNRYGCSLRYDVYVNTSDHIDDLERDRRMKATHAALSAARLAGFVSDSDTEILKDSNHTIIRLVQDGIVAKVVSSHTRSRSPNDLLAQELEIARYLAAHHAPIIKPLEEEAAGPHAVEGTVVTLWRYYEGSAQPGDDEAVGQALRQLDDAFREYSGRLPGVSDKIALATTLIADESRTRKLGEEDRTFLLDVGRSLDRAFGASQLSLRPLHGEPHSDNILWTSDSPLFLDFEGCVRGPIEWDLAYLSDAALKAFPERDDDLLVTCRRAVSYCVAAWCWADPDRAPELRAAAEYHLKALRSSGL